MGGEEQCLIKAEPRDKAELYPKSGELQQAELQVGFEPKDAGGDRPEAKKELVCV